MNPTPERGLEREIARSLADALESAFAPGGAAPELRAARDAAQLLDLPGLDRLIAALAPHAHRPWPAEIRPVVDRLQRVCARAASSEGLPEFRRSDADFHALAGEIVAMEWSSLPARGGARGPSVPTLSAAEMLTDLPLAGDESASVARRVRLTMRVAAAVRAAIDWLAGREGVRRPIELREDASVLEIGCEAADAAGVLPAHEVISGVGGNLGPPLAGEEGGRSWILRVPSFSERPTYVMVEQGRLRLAVPWHAVLKLKVVRRDAIDSRAARLGMTALAPLEPLAGRGPESPVVIVAHGLKRAWMVADRLVWRLPADACEPGGGGLPAVLTRAVCTDDGEVFGLAEPRVLLAGVPLPSLPWNFEKRPAAGEAAPVPAFAEAQPARAETAAPVADMGPLRAHGGPPVLDERWVTPLAAPGVFRVEGEAARESASGAAGSPVAAVIEPAAAPRGAPPPEPAAAPRGVAPPEPAAATREEAPFGSAASREESPPEPAAEHVPVRRALVAEDSITARIFLTRLLHRQGFEVAAVERASDLHAALPRGPWSLVCVDVELPDARGASLLRAVRERLPEDVALVALARDDHDVAAARVAGVWRTLLKPVEPGALRRLLARLGLEERASG